MGTRTLNLRLNEFFSDILGPLARYNQPREEQKKTEKHASVTFLLAENANFHCFEDVGLKLLR
jgi:hypothetical protein